jgi:hypothetical protein
MRSLLERELIMTYHARVVTTVICLIVLQIVCLAQAPAVKTKKAAGKKMTAEVDPLSEGDAPWLAHF